MNAQTQPAALAAFPLNINLTDFIDEFGDELLESLNRSNPPVYTGSDNAHRQLVVAVNQGDGAVSHAHDTSRCSAPRPKPATHPLPGCTWARTEDLGAQHHLAPILRQAFHGRLAVHRCNHDVSWLSFSGSIHHHEVAVMNASANHAVAAGAYQVRVRRSNLQNLIKRDLPLQVILRRTWEAGRHLAGIQAQGSPRPSDWAEDSNGHGMKTSVYCLFIQ
ncbi:hypothetical protein Q050_02265 [Pseudomonas aeruginosa BWHPSA045]|nr:hypothetical protein DPADHS01_23975 [Pseudomonas aeruginosa DHS01]ERV08683.1 hypothetical protein Q072_04190 [Pseudomonas aeruginosa BL18]ERV92879.1 hypothetical protein Q039_02535 [Pseudomonas aeruginosa BWHPSA026]ERX25769.1 hypothetical protein Q012_01198 [Pseudomonas aeruginosa S35004]ERY96241.1 hypothetical protein Q021_01507 [Pseudomonas aeruginosa BWHPSA008]ERZ38850.1 hypothetical protein Q001_02667 [Pseudomonas aeruginosa CF127]ETU73082.1 hypothetical protein Q095_05084 [Pseudomonas